MVLYKEFKDTEEFATMLETHVEEWVTKLTQPQSDPHHQISSPPAIIPEEYKAYIIRECKYMAIDALREDTCAIQLRLPEVYITLYTTASEKKNINKQADKEEQQPVAIEQLVGEQTSLVIKGEAGCGKTTLLKHLV